MNENPIEPDMFWSDSCSEGDCATNDVNDIADSYDVGEAFEVQCAKRLPNRVYIAAVDENNHNAARVATPEESAEFFRLKQERLEAWKTRAKELPKP